MSTIGRMQGWPNFKKLIPKNLSWKVIRKSRRAKSETPWFKRNPASEPWTWPTKSRWFDRELLRPRPKNSSCPVPTPRTYNFPIFSTWFGGSCSGLGRWISPEPRRFRLCPSGFSHNFLRQIFWYQFWKILSPLHSVYSRKEMTKLQTNCVYGLCFGIGRSFQRKQGRLRHADRNPGVFGDYGRSWRRVVKDACHLRLSGRDSGSSCRNRKHFCETTWLLNSWFLEIHVFF